MSRVVLRDTCSYIARMMKRSMSTSDLKNIFLESVRSVQPETLIKQHVCLNNGALNVYNKTFELTKPCYVVGFGKAVLGMSLALEKLLDSKLNRGIVTVPQGIKHPPAKTTKIEYIEGAPNNMPDVHALYGALKIQSLCEQLREDDFLIVLISGGGSALLPLPEDGIKLTENMVVIKMLSNRGADIRELNCVRKRISKLKGGKLAQAIYPCRAVCLILSDIVDDPLDFIASGPTVKNNDSDDDAIDILRKYNLYDNIPESVKEFMSKPQKALTNFDHITNFIIGNNQVACEAARQHAESLKYKTVILSTKLQSSVEDLAEFYSALLDALVDSFTQKIPTSALIDLLHKHQSNYNDIDIDCFTQISFKNINKFCIVAGGEPTVHVKNNKGVGGRNQHLALLMASKLVNYHTDKYKIGFLSCGTDGIDGPTNAAGAISDNAMQVNPESFLANYNSHLFYKQYENGAYLICTGHTGTNVMDIHLITIATIV